ncbi:MAG: AAA family ATPase, partial [Ardenticatenales bacterium]|nr:AAA family ATPase [Ardenticatenales bacterium]
DISGFTPLTEALAQALGPRRGAEELTQQLNLVYDALITEVDFHGGSVVGFAGDAITCWFAADTGRRATACALALQEAMTRVATIVLPGGGQVELAMKVAVASGAIRRFVVGNPQQQLMDVLAGETLARMARAEHLAEPGEVLVDAPTAAALGNALVLHSWRSAEESDEHFAVIQGLTAPLSPSAWPPLPSQALDEAQLRPWLLPTVYERLQGGQGEFLTELRPAVALFLRFAGLDYDTDEAAGEKLNAFVCWVQDILGRYGGSLIQLTIGEKGSYLYAAFGAPIAHEDDARRAVAAATELRVAPEVWPTIQQVQLGISLGTMRSGAYGSATRRSYGVLGDEVNLTARLMQHAAPGQVLASERVQQATAEHFIWRAETAIQVKGKRKAIPLFSLVQHRQQQAIQLQGPTYALPMVGREAELRLVLERLGQALTGQGQIVGITAEAGVGKSRLVAEIIHLANKHGLVGYGGECQSYGTNTPYLVWQPIWRAFFGIDLEAPLETQIHTLSEALDRLNPDLLPRLPLLGTVLALPIPDNELTRPLEPHLRKSSREALLLDCLKRRAATTPLLLVLEDLHWLDPLSHDLLEEVGRVIATLPVLLVLAYRPLELTRLQAPRLTRLPYFTELQLAEFTVVEAERLIEAKLAQLDSTQARVPPEVVEQLMVRAQGNPFYIEELLNLLHDRGLDPHNAQLLSQTELPTSLHSLILSRIDQLSERQKITLKVASVIGRLFRAAWLYGYYPSLGEPGGVKADLEVLNRLELTPLDTPEPELTYIFKHIVTQEVAYESLAYATRALLHEQLAHYLEAQMEREAHSEAYLDLLAYHY